MESLWFCAHAVPVFSCKKKKKIILAVKKKKKKFLEIVHILIGLVPSGVMTTVMQVFSRLLCITLVYRVEEVRESYFFFTMAFAWFHFYFLFFLFLFFIFYFLFFLFLYLFLKRSVTEVIRYSFYALSQMDKVPYFLLWLRYSTFWVLYPMGKKNSFFILFLFLFLFIF